MKRVFVSAGHSEIDPGAVANGKREADVAVEFRNMVAFYLMRDGIQTGLDGKGTQNLPLRQAAASARNYGIAVEFHCNASDNSEATGVETLSSDKNLQLGARITEAVTKALGIRNRGAKPENAGQHSRLAFVQAGGIIVELFFITNPHDLQAYEARKWVAAKYVAEVISQAARGIR